ncbi:trimeric intracellular cation channel family protein [Sulfurimonas sp. SAG-AH-194-I05]|nr:trimeric intracellular cation channel family protein [Sulfurimonas sp. SAG-AH-194-I05]MDF1874409.1 trimeric intracellular cation channel family protein [Sulfurimonas sp. SAG-AH-194-I05]
MFEVTDFIGMIAFAMSGFFVATRSKLDLLGVLIATFLTALGGGILRDIAVNKTPYAFTYDYPVAVVLSVLVFMIVFRFHKRASIENKPLFIISDSIGLISFSISGALIAIESQLNLAGVVIMSFLTAVGGGIVRDVFINEVPFVLKTGFYGTIALLIGIVLYYMKVYSLITPVSITILFISFLTLRFIAYYNNWSIPLK